MFVSINVSGKTATLFKTSLPVSGSFIMIEKGTDSEKELAYFANFMVIDSPSPMLMLNTGPAIVPVIAISPKPFLAIAESATISPKELPHANTVSPNKLVGN